MQIWITGQSKKKLQRTNVPMKIFDDDKAADKI